MASDRKYSALSKLILKKFFDINVDERAVKWSQMMAKQDEDQVQIRELTNSVSACKQQIEGLTQELDTSRRNLASVQKEKQRSEDNCDRLKFNLKKANSAIDKLQDEQKKLQNQVNDYKSIIRDLDTSLGRRAEELEKCYATINTLKNSLAGSELHLREAAGKLEGKQQETNQLQAQKAELEKLLNEQKDVARSQNEMIQNQQAQINTFTQDLISKDSIIQSLNTKLTEVGAQLKEAIKESERWQEETSKLQTEKSELENQLSELKEEHQALQTDFDRSKETVSWLESTLKQKEEEQANVKSLIESLTEEVEKLKAQLEGKQSYIDRAIKFREELTKSNDKLEGEKANLKHQADTQKEIIDEQQAEIDAIKKEKDDLQAQLDTCKGEIDKLRQEQTPQAIIDKYKDEITRLNNLVQSLEDNIQSRDRNIEDLKLQLDNTQERLAKAMNEKETLNQRVSELGNDQTATVQEEDQCLENQVKILAHDLSEAQRTVQQLTENLANARDRIKEQEATISMSRQNYDAIIEKLKSRLNEKEETIRELNDRIKLLEAALAELRLILSENSGADDNSMASQTTVKTGNEHAAVLPPPPATGNTSNNSDEDFPIDLPTLVEDGSSMGERAIKAVINYETGKRIETEEFFRRPKKEISTLCRRLEIISKTDDTPLFICEKCLQPVKISKITKSRGETLFFTHCHRDIPCEWRKENETVAKPVFILDDAEISTAKIEKSRYEKLRDIIYMSLKNQETTGNDVRDIELEKRIKSGTSKSWRLFDVYAKWRGFDVVFKLQRSTDYLRYLVGLDEFCKQEKIFIIWVFGSESATSYSYLQENTYQTTLFDNHSCVFILDREAEKASKDSGELKLKCNWLIDGKHWYYTIARTNSNGVLVSMDDLCFDDTDTYKPYYKGKNEVPNIEADDIVELKPGVFKYRVKTLWGIYNQTNRTQSECKYKDIYRDKDHIIAVIDDIPDDRRGYLSDDGIEIPQKEEISSGIFVLNIFERLCLANKNNLPISKYYDEIRQWCDDRLIIQSDGRFGIIDYHGRVIVEPCYDKLRIVNNHKARVTDYNGKYYIDSDGIIIPDDVIPLNGNFQKVKHFDKWGIMNDKGKLIVDYQYKEIATFRNRFYGFTDDQNFIRLENVERFNYRIPFKATYIGPSSNGHHLLFLCNGIELVMVNHHKNSSSRVIGKEYDVALSNLIRDDKSNITYYIDAWNEKSKDKSFVPTDFDSDYQLGERYTGVIVNTSPNKHRKRIFILFKERRQTYVNVNRNAPNFDQLRKGKSIILEKIGYDPFYEITKWKVIK